MTDLESPMTSIVILYLVVGSVKAQDGHFVLSQIVGCRKNQLTCFEYRYKTSTQADMCIAMEGSIQTYI